MRREKRVECPVAVALNHSKNWGGKRRNAGAPRLPEGTALKRIMFRFSPVTIEALHQLPVGTMSEFVELAVAEKLGLEIL
jgi:hypothetical protein